MRMWMIDPKKMCRKHLLGEHVEIHMFRGVIKRKSHLKGYVKNNCLELNKLKERHDLLVKEIEKRGYVHNSDFIEDYDISYLSADELNSKVDIEKAEKDLISKCEECRYLHKINK